MNPTRIHKWLKAEGAVLTHRSAGRGSVSHVLRELDHSVPGLLIYGPIDTEDQHHVHALKYSRVVEVHDLAYSFEGGDGVEYGYLTTLREMGWDRSTEEKLRRQLEQLWLEERLQLPDWKVWREFWTYEVGIHKRR